jgi:hypothetical protein
MGAKLGLLTLREEHRLRVLENRMPERESHLSMGKLRNEELILVSEKRVASIFRVEE